MRLNFYSSIIAGIDNAIQKASNVQGAHIRNIEISMSEYAKMVTEINDIKDRDIQLEYKKRFKVKHRTQAISSLTEYNTFNLFSPDDGFCNAWIKNYISVTYNDYELNLVEQDKQVNNSSQEKEHN